MFSVEMQVVDNLVPNILLGVDFLNKYEVKLDFGTGMITLHHYTKLVKISFIEVIPSHNIDTFFLAGTYVATKKQDNKSKTTRLSFSSHIETHHRITDLLTPIQYIKKKLETEENLNPILKKTESANKNSLHPVKSNRFSMRKETLVSQHQQSDYNTMNVENGQDHYEVSKKIFLTKSNVVHYRREGRCSTVSTVSNKIYSFHDVTSEVFIRRKIEEIASISSDISFNEKEQLFSVPCKNKECIDVFSSDTSHARVEPIKVVLKD